MPGVVVVVMGYLLRMPADPAGGSTVTCPARVPGQAPTEPIFN
jgi:hypothetical protein